MHPRAPLRALGALLVGCLAALAAPVAHASDAANTIVFYDPDANYEALPRALQALNEYLQAVGYRMQAASDVPGMVEAIKSTHASYVLVGSQYVENLKPFGPQPLLVPQAEGTVYYHKIIVDRGQGAPGDLRGRRVAAATGERSRQAGAKLLSRLKAAGLQTEGSMVLSTTKDLDALLAVTFGQADAALIASNSLLTLTSVNPAAAANMRNVWTSGNILRPILAALKTHDSQDEQKVRAAFTSASANPGARVAMQSLGYEDWVPYQQDFATKGGTL